MDRYKTKYLDKEEKDLIEPYDRINVKTLKKPSNKEQKLFKKAAKEFIKKETKMNITYFPQVKIRVFPN